MRKIILAVAMVGAMTSSIALAQGGYPGGPATSMPAPPPPVEQGNPVGPGMPSATPPAPQTAEDPVPPAMPNDPAYHAGPYKGALTPPPAEAMNKKYPLCSKTVHDSCRNRGGK